jgi:hypothetical protein
MVTKVVAVFLLVLVWNSSAESACVARIIEHDVRIDQKPAVYFSGEQRSGKTRTYYRLETAKHGQNNCPVLEVTPIIVIQIMMNFAIANDACFYNDTYAHEQHHVAIDVAFINRNKHRISQLLKNFNGFQTNDWNRWFRELTDGYVVVSKRLLDDVDPEHEAFDRTDYPLAHKRIADCKNKASVALKQKQLKPTTASK